MAHQRNFQIDAITNFDEYDAIGVVLAHSAGAGWTSRDTA
jgi:hypothetical protein